MSLSPKAAKIHSSVSKAGTKLGDLRKLAKEIKKDHALAMELWNEGGFMPRQLAILIMDKKQLSQDVINQLDEDIQKHEYEDRLHLMDWLMANQLSKDKQLVKLMESWENSSSPLQRRIFWYYQARLRWMGRTGFENNEYLLKQIEKRVLSEAPEVQWAMNYTAGQIGKFEKHLRKRCIAIGEKTGLYKDEVVPKNCTPNYLPDFIAIEVAKLK